MLNTPGVTADTTSPSSGFGAGMVDSVDGDDGDPSDGTCADCDALFGSGLITFTFDGTALGGLPTHVGAVWTDGGAAADVTFEAFDEADVSLGLVTAPALGDAMITGETAEDRFFGGVAPGGVARIRFANTSGGTEVDHLQYGR